MGKNKRGNSNKKTKSKKTKVQYSADDLLNKVEEYIDCFEYDLALKFCEKALSIDPSNLRGIETSACVFAETGDIEKSKEYFMKAVELSGDKGHEKYMYLGQMTTGSEAQKWYLKGIDIMNNEISKQGGELVELDNENRNSSRLIHKGPVSKSDVSNAYCSLAEIFMTDSCFEDDAEKQCEKYCQLALENDPGNIDAYIVNANYLLSTEKQSNAKDLLGKCFELLKIKVPKAEEAESMDETVDEDEDKELDAQAADEVDEENDNLPPYPSRVTLAKLLTEVQEYEKSELILAGLIEEDEEDIEIWYMFGWNLFLEKQFKEAVTYLEKALELSEKEEFDDQELVNHLKEILVKCKNQENGCDEGMEVEE